MGLTGAYRPGDEERIRELFRLAYGGRHLADDYWTWRFRDGPAGPGLIELCFDGDVLAAHYAVTPVAIRIDGETRMTGLSGTTVTHPAYRGRGLFPALAAATYARMAAAGMALVWGFPNSASHRGFVRDLHWVDIYEVPTFRLPLAEGVTALTVPEQVVEVDAPDERFDRLWERVRGDYAIIAQRDARQLEWRYRANPAEQYRLIAYSERGEAWGYAVFKRHHDEVQVVDVLVGHDAADVGEGLMAYVIREAYRQSAASVGLWLNVTHPLHRALERLGFRPEGPVTYLAGLALQPRFGGSLYDIRRWYFTMGDSDVF
jgi:hypothetical protein